ncbi:MAG: sulfurtransferase [Gammaproteobacteria bacterium]|nr:sulfurtransferase [Gammaproteobacteria bacterium]
MMGSVTSDYLVSADDLDRALGDPDLRLFETAANLEPKGPGMERELGRVAFDRRHIPGAQFLDLAGDAADTASGLEFTLPEPAALEELFRRLGVNMDSRVVLYSSSSVMWSTRAWWLLHYLGFERMSVLDGGFDAWRGGGRPVERVVPRFPRGDFEARPRPEVFADKQAVADAIGDSAVRTVNSLGAAMHRGETRSSYARQGRIAGSGNLPFSELLTEGRFKSTDEMRAVLAASGMLDADRVITYCGAGIAATIDAFACVLVGQDRVAVYDGSLSEWALDPNAPMETGASG